MIYLISKTHIHAVSSCHNGLKETDIQKRRWSFDKSIKALQELNAAGYGTWK
jgi:hypothetical protein